MKNLLSIFMLVFLCAGCYSTYFYTDYMELTYEEPEYTNIPMKPNKSEIQVIFPGEKILKPYIKVDIIESSSGVFTSTKALIKDLKIKGMFRGVDAIVLMSNNTFSHDDGEYVTSVKSASALGIKYVENIDYLDDCVKRVKVIAFDKRDNEYKTTALIKTNWKGSFLELKEGNSFFWDFLYNFSDQHLIHEMSGWSFNRRKGMDGKNYLRRVFGSNKTVVLNFTNKNEANLFVEDKRNKKYSARIKSYYNDDGYLISKEIDSEKLGKFKIEVTLGENNLPLRYDVYKLLKGEKEFYFKAIFEMYEQEDLEKFLAKENVIGR